MQSLDLVIVTYNRLGKLKNTLQHYENQTKGFRNLIIVNNCSTDGTEEYLKEWCNKVSTYPESSRRFNSIVITANDNLGGSGGFYLGEKKAMELNADWVFVADDDAYADPKMVEEFYMYIENHDTSKVAAVCAQVLNVDGSPCLYHRDTHKIINNEYKRFSSKVEDYKKEYFLIDDFSYVGTFMSGKALKKVGLVNPKYFIYYDDSEHSIRMKKYGDIVVVPAIRITHDGGAETTPKEIELSWRNFYMHRNTTHMLLKHYPRAGWQIVYKQFRDDFHAWRTGAGWTVWAKMMSVAVWSALFGRLGKHKLYKPGWLVLRNKCQ